MNIYTPTSAQIVHETSVDFGRRIIQKPVHVVQYDRSLPVIAVKMFLNGYSYTLPANAEVNVRWGKRDHTFVYNPVLGCDESRQTVYFLVDEQMTYFNGSCNPIIELVIGTTAAGSSSIPVEIDRNPIQENDIESSVEYIALEKAVEEAKEAAESADASKVEAGASATAASNSAEAAANSAGSAAQSATNAATSETNAAESAESAAESLSHVGEVVMIDEPPTDYTKLKIDTDETFEMDIPSMEEFNVVSDKVNEFDGKLGSYDKRITRLEDITNIKDMIENETGKAYEITVPSQTATFNSLKEIDANPHKVDKASRVRVLGNTVKSGSSLASVEMTGMSLSGDNIYNGSSSFSATERYQSLIDNTDLGRFLKSLPRLQYFQFRCDWVGIVQENVYEQIRVYYTDNTYTTLSNNVVFRLKDLPINYIYAYFGTAGSARAVGMNNMMIIKSDGTPITNLKYVPYTGQSLSFETPIHLDGLDTHDEIFNYVDNGYLVTKKIQRYDKYTFTGNENWQEWFDGTTKIGYSLINTNVPFNYDFSKGDDIRGLCDKLEVRVNGGGNFGTIGLRQLGDYKTIYLPNTDGVNWLKANTPTLVFKIVPTITEISRVPLAEGFDFEEVTNVLVTNTNAGLADATTEIQNGVVKSPATEAIEIVGANIIGNTWTAGTCIDNVITLNTRISQQEVLAIKGINRYYLKMSNVNRMNFVFYDANNSQLGQVQSTNSGIGGNNYFDVPQNTYKIQVSFNLYSNTTLPYTTFIGLYTADIDDYIPYAHHIMLTNKLTAIESKLNSLGTSLKYGDLDLVGKKFTKKYSKKDIGVLNWGYNTSFANPAFSVTIADAKGNGTGIANAWLSMYNTVYMDYTRMTNMTIQIREGGNTILRNESMTNVQMFKDAMSGVELTYELVNSVEIDLSDILTDDDEFIQTEPGGTVTFENAEKLPVGYSIDWLKLGGNA